MPDANDDTTPLERLESELEDLKAELHRERQKHQETRWKYGDAVREMMRWRKAFEAYVRASMPEEGRVEVPGGE